MKTALLTIDSQCQLGLIVCVYSGFRREVQVIRASMGYYAAYSG